MSEGMDAGTSATDAYGGAATRTWTAADIEAGRETSTTSKDMPQMPDVTFHDVLHALNPLQHLPVIGTIYRAVTGDTIAPPFRIAGSIVGGMISGGPLGVLLTVAGCFLEEFMRIGPNLPSPDGAPAVPASPPPSAAETQRMAAMAAYRNAESWMPG